MSTETPLSKEELRNIVVTFFDITRGSLTFTWVEEENKTLLVMQDVNTQECVNVLEFTYYDAIRHNTSEDLTHIVYYYGDGKTPKRFFHKKTKDLFIPKVMLEEVLPLCD